MNFNDLVLAILASKNVDPRLQTRYKYWAEIFGHKDPFSITLDDVESAMDALARRGKLQFVTGKGFVNTGVPHAPGTINRYVGSLGSIYKEARRLRLTPRGFVTPTKGFQKGPENPGRIIKLSREQIDRIIDASRISRWRKATAFITVAMSSGARVGNLQTLIWRDVDLTKGTVYFPTSKNGNPYAAALSPIAITELKRIRRESDSPDSLVFGKRAYRKIWARTLELAGVDYFPFHGCRHICASMLSASGASIATVMAQMNHKTTSMALRYSHLNVDQLKSSVLTAWT